MKNFFLVEDHTLMRKGIIKTIEESSDFRCLASAASYDDALKMFDNYSEKISKEQIPCIVDLNLGKQSGLYIIEEMLKKYKNIRFVVYSMYLSPGIVNQAMELGAAAYVSKNADESELLDALKAVTNGETYIEKNLLNNLYSFKSVFITLTKREKQVFNYILDNKTNEEIADFLCIEKRAVENYTSRLYDKMNVEDRSELIRMYGGGGTDKYSR